MSTPFHDRLQESIENHGLTQKEFAEIIQADTVSANMPIWHQMRHGVAFPIQNNHSGNGPL